jgi:hypothetical protein
MFFSTFSVYLILAAMSVLFPVNPDGSLSDGEDGVSEAPQDIVVQTPIFADLSTEKLVQFEKDLAYDFGVPFPQPILKAYGEALAFLELSHGRTALENGMFSHLTLAYQEIADQNGWTFDVEFAAESEMALILAQARKHSQHKIESIMTILYQTVFEKASSYKKFDETIKEAAQLRTKLYQEKVMAVQAGQLTLEKQKELLAISDQSKEILRELEKQATHNELLEAVEDIHRAIEVYNDNCRKDYTSDLSPTSILIQTLIDHPCAKGPLMKAFVLKAGAEYREWVLCCGKNKTDNLEFQNRLAAATGVILKDDLLNPEDFF